jgi:hypothetical protein
MTLAEIDRLARERPMQARPDPPPPLHVMARRASERDITHPN